MSVSIDDLRTEVRTTSDDDPVLTRTLAEARTMVEEYIDEYGVLDEGEEVPAQLVDAAILACGVDLWTRKQAAHGVTNEQYDADMGTVSTPIRISRDPLRSFEHLLTLYCVRVVV